MTNDICVAPYLRVQVPVQYVKVGGVLLFTQFHIFHVA